MAVGALASFTLTMAVNTAFVASSELMERVAHRYGFHWLIATNRRQSLYRIHLSSATFFSLIIFLTMGSQAELANMYALGLLASFCINMGSLIIYRYFKGTTEGMTYSTSRLGTLILCIILVSCFVFLAIDKAPCHDALGHGNRGHAPPGVSGGQEAISGDQSRLNRGKTKWR